MPSFNPFYTPEDRAEDEGREIRAAFRDELRAAYAWESRDERKAREAEEDERYDRERDRRADDLAEYWAEIDAEAEREATR